MEEALHEIYRHIQQLDIAGADVTVLRNKYEQIVDEKRDWEVKTFWVYGIAGAFILLAVYLKNVTLGMTVLGIAAAIVIGIEIFSDTKLMRKVDKLKQMTIRARRYHETGRNYTRAE